MTNRVAGPPKFKLPVLKTGTGSTTKGTGKTIPTSKTNKPVVPAVKSRGVQGKPVVPLVKPKTAQDKPVVPPIKPKQEQQSGRSKLETLNTVFSIAANAASTALSLQNIAKGLKTTQLQDGTVVNHETNTVQLPDGCVVDQANKTVIHPDGTRQLEDGTTVHPDGSTEDAQGDIKYADGRWYIAAQKVTVHPGGIYQYDNGIFTDAEGNQVDNPFVDGK